MSFGAWKTLQNIANYLLLLSATTKASRRKTSVGQSPVLNGPWLPIIHHLTATNAAKRRRWPRRKSQECNLFKPSVAGIATAARCFRTIKPTFCPFLTMQNWVHQIAASTARMLFARRVCGIWILPRRICTVDGSRRSTKCLIFMTILPTGDRKTRTSEAIKLTLKSDRWMSATVSK